MTAQAGLMVGIDFYPNPDDYLPGCTADAAAVRDFFQTPRGGGIDHLTLLENGYASREAVLASLQEVAGELREAPLERFILFFAGHLAPSGLVCAEEELLELWELAEVLARVPALHKMLILDACAGAMPISSPLSVPIPGPGPADPRATAGAHLPVLAGACPGLRVMTAVQRDRTGALLDRRGPFTRALLTAGARARPEAGSYHITAEQVFRLAYDELAEGGMPLPMATGGLEAFPFAVGF